ncbi:Solute carrier family 2 [Phytophthora citrophthora]|uniref:Hexose transporter 1 n=1 Tax=Phytophthora citrophthora TaxID=4793 RepID=A0AAD9GSI7_9STRA|nr:Solute carrier family 2 [Phytophthora citrophthora]
MGIPSPSLSSTSDYVKVTTTAPPAPNAHAPVRPRWALYANVLLSLLQPLQYGWSTTQLNLTTFNNEDECDARPVAPGTCLMFPGHTKVQWTIAVSAWILGGMVGALVIGRFSNIFGRKRTMMLNCLFMIVGAAVQASASSIWMFVVGRVISGIASGGATAVIPGFISEISPPTLRNSLGVGFQIAITVGNLLVAITFFFADTNSGWRYIAGFPIALALLFMTLAPFVMVESPAWLIMMGKHHQAERELARLYGEENVYLAKSWLKQDDDPTARVASSSEYVAPLHNANTLTPPKPCSFAKLFSPMLIRQLFTAIGVAGAQQLTGINAVFFYSSTLFEQAGISDDRIGIVAVNFVNVLPTMFCGMLAARMGNRKLILYGLAGMFFSAVGITISLVASLPALAIVFTACYVTTFGSSLGSLAWVVMADLFPDDVRAVGNSVCVGCSWLSNLAVGLGYPYIAAELVNFSFTPFMCTVALSFLFVYMAVPDTSGKTTAEIQEQFNARSARLPLEAEVRQPRPCYH